MEVRSPEFTWILLASKNTGILLNFTGNFENTPGCGCSPRAATVGGTGIFRRKIREKREECGSSRWEDYKGGGCVGLWCPGKEDRRLEASVGRRFRWLFPAIYGVKGDEYKLGFAREEDMSLSVLVYPWDVVGRQRARARSNAGDEREEYKARIWCRQPYRRFGELTSFRRSRSLPI